MSQGKNTTLPERGTLLAVEEKVPSFFSCVNRENPFLWAHTPTSNKTHTSNDSKGLALRASVSNLVEKGR